MLAELEELAGALRAAGSPVVENLRPGLTSAEWERQAARLPFRLPDEVEALFRWHDGVDDRGLTMGRDLVVDGSFCPLSEAIDAYLELAELLGLDEDPTGDGIWSAGVFPFLGADSKGMWVALCAETTAAGTPCAFTITEDASLMDVSPTLRLFVTRAASRWRAGNYVATSSGYARSGVPGRERGPSRQSR